jgi:hypothetical protein
MPGDSTSDVRQLADKPASWLRWLRLALLVAAVAFFAYRPFMKLTGETRVRKVCAALTPGMSMDDVAKFADAHGMYPPSKASDGYFIGDKATANYFICLLEFKDGVLQNWKYFDFQKKTSH